ncbi:hypothetical protein WSM22_37340 [Cytophagales bacterium WSM2-2]|nr:hypothetical protein WSM22_37340 [Cytophagales bacterium WSM2-2]
MTAILKIGLLVFALDFSVIVVAQDSIQSKMYSWQKPVHITNRNILSATLFEGSAHDMSYMQMSANTLMPSKGKIKLTVPANEERLLFIKTGVLSISIGDSSRSIGRGSVVLLLPNEKYSLQSGKDSCSYYMMNYHSKSPISKEKRKEQGSMVIDWNKVAFKPHDRGGIRNFFERPTAMCRRLEIHVTTLNEGIKSHEPHRHRAEEIVLVIDNKTEMQIADAFHKGNTGDLYYLGSNVSHAIRNDGKGQCIYYAIQFE